MSRHSRHRVARAAATVLIALAALACGAASAYADGDPASDVLAIQKLFVPTDANVPEREQLQLNSLLDQSARKGYPLRVAIVGSPIDLGSVTAFWRRPVTYARFLGSELALVYHGTVLVVMPNGYGTYVTSSGVRAASGRARLPLPGQHLGSAAIAAVERLAIGAGTPLTAPRPAVSAQTIPHHGSDLPLIVFGTGFIPLLLAWGLSLRRRPLTLRVRRT